METSRSKRERSGLKVHRGLIVVVPLVMLITDCGPVSNERSVRLGTDASPSGSAFPAASPAVSAPEPLVDLAPGYHLVNVVTGETSPMPESITEVQGASNFEVSRDGSMILFDNSGYRPRSDEAGLHQIYVANADGTHVRRVTQDELGASSGSWSPDGSSIVFIGGMADLENGWRMANISVLDLDTGEAAMVLPESQKGFEDPHFDSDGRSVVFSRWDTHSDFPDSSYGQWDLWSVPVAGGKPTIAIEGRGRGDVAPDGKSILYPRITSFCSGNGCSSLAEVWISDADRQDPRPLVPVTLDHLSAWAEAGWSPNGVWVGYTQSVLSGESGVYYLNLLTRERTLITFGQSVDWLDHWTMIVRADPAA
jgi:dipeptidyl aminopeptidase/acylaminoacyl peptidase